MPGQTATGEDMPPTHILMQSAIVCYSFTPHLCTRACTASIQIDSSLVPLFLQSLLFLGLHLAQHLGDCAALAQVSHVVWRAIQG